MLCYSYEEILTDIFANLSSNYKIEKWVLLFKEP